MFKSRWKQLTSQVSGSAKEFVSGVKEDTRKAVVKKRVKIFLNMLDKEYRVIAARAYNLAKVYKMKNPEIRDVKIKSDKLLEAAWSKAVDKLRRLKS